VNERFTVLVASIRTQSTRQQILQRFGVLVADNDFENMHVVTGALEFRRDIVISGTECGVGLRRVPS
jgi:hypothetical protein